MTNKGTIISQIIKKHYITGQPDSSSKIHFVLYFLPKLFDILGNYFPLRPLLVPSLATLSIWGRNKFTRQRM